MKTKQLKQVLQQKAAQVRIQNHSQDILPSVIYKEKKQEKKLKHFIPLIATFACIAIIVFTVLIQPNSVNMIHNTLSASSDQQIIGRESFAIGSSMQKISNLSKKKMSESEESTVAKVLNPYVSMIDTYFTPSILKIESKGGQDDTYANTLELTFEETRYIYFYNEEETIRKGKNYSYKTNGILTVNEQQYTLIGEIENYPNRSNYTMCLLQDEKVILKIIQNNRKKVSDITYQYIEDEAITKTITLCYKENLSTQKMDVTINENMVQQVYKLTKEGENKKAFYKNDLNGTTNFILSETKIENIYQFENQKIILLKHQ